MTLANHVLFSVNIEPDYVNAAGINVLHVVARGIEESEVDKHGVPRSQNSAARDSLVIALLKHEHAPDPHQEDAQQWTPMSVAIAFDNAHFVRILLEHSDVVIDRVGSTGVSPWQHAIEARSWSIIHDMLVFRGPKVSHEQQKRLTRLAANAKRSDVIHALLDCCLYGNQAPEQRESVPGDTILLAVIREGATPPFVRGVLGMRNPPDINAVNSANETALSVALSALPRYLCEGFDVATETERGVCVDVHGPIPDCCSGPDEALFRCLVKERCHVVRLLLRATPRPNTNFRHDDGSTPLLLAAKQANPKLVEMLLNASPPADIAAVNNAGETLLMLLLSATYDSNHIEGGEVTALITRVIEASRESINAQDFWGETALHRAVSIDIDWDDPAHGGAAFCRAGRGFVPHLLKAGADPDLVDLDGDTPLLVALQSGTGCTARLYYQDEYAAYGWQAPCNEWLTSLIAAQKGPLCKADVERCPLVLAAQFFPDAVPLLMQRHAREGVLCAAHNVSHMLMHAAAWASYRGVSALLKACPALDVNARCFCSS